MVAIKDMEMPRNCHECDFENYDLLCNLLDWKVGSTAETRHAGRLPDCPLIEVDEPTMEEYMSDQDMGDPEDGRL